MVDGMTQIKFTIEESIVAGFKSRCAKEGVSMASAARQFMETHKPARDVKIKILTRPMRKKAVLEIIGLLNDIMGMEEQYRDSIPEQFTNRYEAAEGACEQLASAIECLEGAFQ
jgi:hypothetical protein